MPPIRCRAQVTLERRGAVPRDAIVNTWHFEGDDEVGSTDDERFMDLAPGLASRLDTFYNAIESWLSSTLSGNGKVRLYNMRHAEPRIPMLTHNFTITPGASALPGEVAVCVTLQGLQESGVNMRRRRGRVFLGPLAAVASEVPSGSPDARPHTNLFTVFNTALSTMALGGAGAFRLAIYSPTAAAVSSQPDDDDAWNDLERFWIDNAWDTIRKRGAAPTARVGMRLTNPGGDTWVAI